MLNRVVRFLADKLVDWCVDNDRVHLIKGDGEKTVYLVRYIVLKSKFLTIFIHRFLRSDKQDPHDHPWNFFTYIISGCYYEHFYDRSAPLAEIDLKQTINGTHEVHKVYTQYWSKTTNVRKEGSVAYRRANDIHRVELDRSYTLDEIHLAPYTVCFIGPRVREWGFWTSDTIFVDWRRHLNINSPKDPRIEGSK